MEDSFQQDVNYLIGTAPDPADAIEAGPRETIFAIIWQAYCDLTHDQEYQRWDAQRFFHDRESFDVYADAVGLNADATRERLIKQGLLGTTAPPARAGADDDESSD